MRNFLRKREWLKSSLLNLWLGLTGIGIAAGCGTSSGDFSTCLEDGSCIQQVEVKRYSGVIPLDPADPFWVSGKGPKEYRVELGPQLITNPQWPDPSIKEVRIRFARTDTELAVRLEWEDATVDNGLGNSRLYTDQAAIMFPRDRSSETPPVTMGAPGEVVNIWQWKAVRQADLNRPASSSGEEASGRDLNVSPVEDLNAEGFSTLTRQDRQDVMGRGIRGEKTWQVVFKRALTDSDDNDVQFTGPTPMAVAVWDGGNRETNGQKGLAGWILLQIN